MYSGDITEYQKVVDSFVEWGGLNHPYLDIRKTKQADAGLQKVQVSYHSSLCLVEEEGFLTTNSWESTLTVNCSRQQTTKMHNAADVLRHQ